MAVTLLDPCGDADFGVGLIFNATLGTNPVVASTAFVHGNHQRSYSFATANVSQYAQMSQTLVDAGGRMSYWIYITAYPANLQTIHVFNTTGLGAPTMEIKMFTDGTLQVWNATTGQIGVSSAAIPLSTWVRVSYAWTITSTTVNQIKLWLNGVLQTSIVNTTLTRTGTTDLLWGNAGGGAETFYGSDFYLDDSNSMTEPGNIWVTAKRPVANGTTNGFSTQIGSGGSGYGSGHAPQVNERALSTSNGWSMVGAGSAITEEYNIESEADGDIDIPGATIVDWMGWASMSSLVGETVQMILNGATFSQAITSSIVIYQKIAGSTTYPLHAGADIGIQTDTSLTTVSLYECGIVVAYIPSRSIGFSNYGKSIQVENSMSRSEVAN